MIAVDVGEKTDVAHARQRVGRLADRTGLPEVQREALRARAELVVSELATNLVRHAGSGEILASLHGTGEDTVLRVWSIDGGPGMADVAACIRDGYSTSGTSGTGLGAVERTSDRMDVYSDRARGTVITCDLSARRPQQAAGVAAVRGFDVGAVVLPKLRDQECGDAWSVRDVGQDLLVMVADGLGHGPLAAVAGREASITFTESDDVAPVELLHRMHEDLSGTRGAAAAVAHLAPATGTVTYAGIGNIAGLILAPDGRRSMVSLEGIVGHRVRKVQGFQYGWSDDAVLVMHSDGLVSSWSLQDHRGLLNHGAAVIAGVLYRDFKRGRDDVCVVVAKGGERP